MSEPERSEQASNEAPADDEAGPAPDADATVAEGVEHLQAAAWEMIAAARTFLDVVEEVVGDNAALASVAEAVGSFSQVVSRAAGRAPAGGGAARPPADDDEGPGRSRVQHIDLS